MPRLTNPNYLRAHFRLVGLWQTDRSDFSLLSPQEQRHLHDYFHPSELLSREDALAHRKTVTIEHPSLPQQAGKALRKLDVARASPASTPVTNRTKTGQRARVGRHRVVVKAVIQPTVDIDAFSRALLRAAKDFRSDEI